MPVWLGPGASEGAISIVTHDFQPEPEGAEKKKGITRLKLSGGSFGRLDGSVSHTAPLTGGSLMLTAAGGRLDGKRTNADRDKGDLSVHWDRGGKGAVRYELNGRYYISEHGSAGPVDNPTPDARQRYEKFLRAVIRCSRHSDHSRWMFSGIFLSGGTFFYSNWMRLVDNIWYK